MFCTLDKSKVDNGAEIVINKILDNSPVLNHPEVCGHNLVSQVLWLGYCWIFDNITASIYIQKSLKVILVTLDDLYDNATYHVDELRQFEFELYCDWVRLVPHWSDLGCFKLYLEHK